MCWYLPNCNCYIYSTEVQQLRQIEGSSARVVNTNFEVLNGSLRIGTGECIQGVLVVKDLFH